MVGYDDSPLIAFTDPPLTTAAAAGPGDGPTPPCAPSSTPSTGRPTPHRSSCSIRSSWSAARRASSPGYAAARSPSLLAFSADRDPSPCLLPDWWRDRGDLQIYCPQSSPTATATAWATSSGSAARLPYLRDLGVDAIWLTPFYRSPQADGGYDVADYRDVDPLFGTLADFDALLAAAHALGIRVIVDLCPTTRSDQHAWFKEALASAPGSPARDRYLFRDGRGRRRAAAERLGVHLRRPGLDPASPGRRVVPAPVRPRQPDLNWDNAGRARRVRAVLRFWLDRGSTASASTSPTAWSRTPACRPSGTRSRSGCSARGPLPYFDQDGVHEIYRAWRRSSTPTPATAIAGRRGVGRRPRSGSPATSRPDELHQAFNFDFLAAPWDAAALRDGRSTASRPPTRPVGAPTTWVLSNHDIVRHATARPTRPASASADGADELGLRRARAAALLMLALPGSAYLYQGEELGPARGPGPARRRPPGPGVVPLRRRRPRPRRLPRAAAVDRGRARLRLLRHRPRLAAPAGLVGADRVRAAGCAASFLELYREALRLRRTFTGPLTWHDSPADVLDLQRDGVRSVVNLSGVPVPIPPGEVLLSSVDLPDGHLPPDTAVWLG